MKKDIQNTSESAQVKLDNDRLYRLSDICRITTLGRSTIYNLLKTGALVGPSHIINGKLKAWSAAEIQKVLDSWKV